VQASAASWRPCGGAGWSHLQSLQSLLRAYAETRHAFRPALRRAETIVSDLMPPIMIRHAAFPHMSVYMCGCLCNGVRASLLLLQPLQSTESRLAVYASYWKHCAAAVQQRHVVVASLGCCIQAQCCRAVQAEHILGGVHLLAFSDAAKQDTCTSSTRALCRSIRHAHGSAWHPYRMQHELGWLHATHGPQAGRQASHHEMLPTPQWQHLSRLASSRLGSTGGMKPHLLSGSTWNCYRTAHSGVRPSWETGSRLPAHAACGMDAKQSKRVRSAVRCWLQSAGACACTVR